MLLLTVKSRCGQYNDIRFYQPCIMACKFYNNISIQPKRKESIPFPAIEWKKLHLRRIRFDAMARFVVFRPFLALKVTKFQISPKNNKRSAMCIRSLKRNKSSELEDSKPGMLKYVTSLILKILCYTAETRCRTLNVVRQNIFLSANFCLLFSFYEIISHLSQAVNTYAIDD